MLLIILLVIFVVVMLLWVLSLLGAVTTPPAASPWLAFIAVLVLGTVVFLYGSGVIEVERLQRR